MCVTGHPPRLASPAPADPTFLSCDVHTCSDVGMGNEQLGVEMSRELRQGTPVTGRDGGTSQGDGVGSM